MSSGLDDFERDPIRWDPPTPPMVVDASRSGIVMVEQERDEDEVDTPSAADFEARMDAAGHQPGEAEAELAEQPRVEAEDRERGEVEPSVVGTNTVSPSSAPPPDALVSPSQASQEPQSGPEDGDGTIGAAADLSEPQEIEASLAERVDGVPVPQTIEEVVSQSSYEPDDPEDTRRVAPDHRRCTALAHDQRRCRSYAMKEAVLCAGHAGVGLAADPSRYAPLATEARRQLKLTRQMVGGGAKMGPRAALRLEALRKAEPLAQRIIATALDPESGVGGANVALRVLDAIDPMVSVEATTSEAQLIAKVQRGEDPTWSELRAVFAPDPGVTAAEAEALSA